MRIELAQRTEQLLSGIGELPGGATCGRVLNLIEECLGPNFQRFPDGRMLIWDLARHDGYTIPAYPMAGCGDVREFLHDEGARNVPDWYRIHLGIDRETYDRIWEWELIMVRNRLEWRRVFMVPSQVMAQTHASAGPLLQAELGWLRFALGTQTGSDDPGLFMR